MPLSDLMKSKYLIVATLLASTLQMPAQETPSSKVPEGAAILPSSSADAPPQEARRDLRCSLAVIEDATVYGGLQVPLPQLLNQVLVEPTVTLRYKPQWSFSTSLIGLSDRYSDTTTQLRVKEAYVGLSAGDFDFMAGRRMVRWGTGYAFTAAGVLDPPRMPTNPSDRLNLNQGRDMVKADYVHGPHAFTLAWSSAALAPTSTSLRDTTAFRYNVLVHGFDTALIAGRDRGGDSFGALTFTRVLGEAWEIHGEAAWREQAALLAGAKFTTRTGITFLGEFFTPPNIPYFQQSSMYPLIGRQHLLYLSAGKNRLREIPAWKEWDLSASAVANLNDRSFTAVLDATRRFGNHLSSYVHSEIPVGSGKSQFGATPYSTATSIGLRFQL